MSDKDEQAGTAEYYDTTDVSADMQAGEWTAHEGKDPQTAMSGFNTRLPIADPDRVFTVEDMEDMPDDEFRYELDDGMLIMSAVPSLPHQIAVMRLAFVLNAVCPSGLLVVAGPGININKFQHRVPDLVVMRSESVTPMFLTDPPILAVEVASPRTGVYDKGRKRDVYEKFGIHSYWIVDVGQDKPSLTVLELHRGKYVETARVVGDEGYDAARPFPVRVVPADLA